MRTLSHALFVVASTALACSRLATAAETAAPAQTPYAAECGSCHLAYPAKLLSRADWGRVLSHLDRHYGVDASLDPATLGTVARHLGATPSSAAVSNDGALPRITAQPWFREEHDEAGAAVFRSPKVRSASNCSACHAGAERGDFKEHSVRIPR